MMSRKLSSRLLLTKQQLTTTTAPTIINTNNERQSKIVRWICGMIIGSAPFLIILFSWMFVSICVNNFVRLYQYRKKRYRRATQTNEIENIISKTDI
ncbi:unnamed protein product [Adineta steineri]|uniref:Uncharacterized protein n=1 Tax=Adineta steineri TaxID=433720 RepID=A0A818HLD2_9BILA|nr:unnamed protein product [Adineta steineri]CAF0803124.1 unnamed protein product [Adineta steineri]CAF3510446.1 unnamed protein product [Adineta steineri]